MIKLIGLRKSKYRIIFIRKLIKLYLKSTRHSKTLRCK